MCKIFSDCMQKITSYHYATKFCSTEKQRNKQTLFKKTNTSNANEANNLEDEL